MSTLTQELAPALAVDARLAELERDLDLLLNLTPVNAEEAGASHFGAGTLSGPAATDGGRVR